MVGYYRPVGVGRVFVIPFDNPCCTGVKKECGSGQSQCKALTATAKFVVAGN